jgi:hypothetical protein
MERAKEEEKTQAFPDWWTRIWTGAFLVVVLGGLGALCGLGMCLRLFGMSEVSQDQARQPIAIALGMGAVVGVTIAAGFLYRYYTRKL